MIHKEKMSMLRGVKWRSWSLSPLGDFKRDLTLDNLRRRAEGDERKNRTPLNGLSFFVKNQGDS